MKNLVLKLLTDFAETCAYEARRASQQGDDEGSTLRKIKEGQVRQAIEDFKRYNGINDFVNTAHSASFTAGWWDDTDMSEKHVVPAKIALIHSELSEALEGDRTGSMDKHLPHRRNVEVELGDAMIRIADLAGAMELDLGGAIVEKMAYNTERADHKKENRETAGGKKY